MKSNRVLKLMLVLLGGVLVAGAVSPVAAQDELPVVPETEFVDVEPPLLVEGEGVVSGESGFDPLTGDVDVSDPAAVPKPGVVEAVEPERTVVDTPASGLVDSGRARADLPLLDPVESETVLDKGGVRFPNTPFGLTVPPSARSNARASLKVVGKERARQVSSTALAVAELSLDGRTGRGIGRGLDVAAGRIPDVAVRSGWLLEVDPSELPTVSQNVLDRLAIFVWAGCDEDGSPCSIVESLPTYVDSETGVLRAALPPSVVREFGGVANVGTRLAGGAGGTFGPGLRFAGFQVGGSSGGSTAFTGVAPGVSGATGTYAADSNGSLASWQVGTHTGHAQVSYPMPLPPATGPMPNVGLSYSSGLVDGMNASKNNQPSKVGIGWNMNQPVIQRVTRTCAGNDLGGRYTGNLCLATSDPDDGFVLSMDGASGRLVKTSGSGNHPFYTGATYQAYELEIKNDLRIWKVKHPWGAGDIAGGTDGMMGEWWEITAGDGTVSVFGRNWVLKPTTTAGSDPLSQPRTVHTSYELNSTQVVPVMVPSLSGPDCNGNVCPIETAWYLDQVIDTRGNMSIYRFWMDQNRYSSKNWGTTVLLPYDKSVNAQFIDYGVRYGDTPKTASENPAAFRVKYDYQWRNETNNINSGEGWWDTPIDLMCYANASCANESPTFFDHVRLHRIRTRTVTQWATELRLGTYFPDVATSERKLWLSTVQRYDGNQVAVLPAVKFNGVLKQNRVNGGSAPMNMYRIFLITTERGGKVEFTYGQPYAPSSVGGSACSKVGQGPPNGYIRLPCNMFIAWDAHTDGGGWVLWNSYVVTKLKETPVHGLDSDYTELTYNYDVPPDWAYSSQYGFTEKDPGQCKTGWGCNHWNDYRGHRQVSITDRSGAKTTAYTYTGMADDRYSESNTATLASAQPSHPAVLAPRPDGASVPNSGWAAGISLGTTNAASSGAHTGRHLSTTAAITSTPKWPTSVRVTETREYPFFIDPTGVEPLEQRQEITYYDSIGRVTQVRDDGAYDFAGGTWSDGDERTTFYQYTSNTADWIVSLPYRVSTRAQAGGPNPDGGWMSAVEVHYDNQAHGAPPTKGGLTTRRTQIRQNASGDPIWQNTSYAYNSRGQVTTENNVSAGSVVTHTYDPTYGWRASTDGALPGVGDKTTFMVDPRFGVQISIDPPNVGPTILDYDGIGRIETVIEPGDTPAQPSNRFNYFVSQTGPSWTHTETLRDKTVGASYPYVDAWSFVDGFNRPILSQTRQVDGTGTIATATSYGTTGQVKTQTRPYFAGTNLGTFAQPASFTAHDRTTNTFNSNGIVTTEHYRANQTTAVATASVRPAGLRTYTTDRNGRVSNTKIDVHGNTLSTTDVSGATTTYTYNQRDDLTSVTDPGNNTISWVFNRWETQPTQLDDPNLGIIIYSYDNAGRVESQTDGNGTTLEMEWRNDFQPTRIKTTTGATVTEWDYDPSTGRVDSSTHNNNPGNPAPEPVTKAFGYDPVTGEPTSTTWTIPGIANQTISQTFNPAGSIDTITYPGAGNQSFYSYNLNEQPTGLFHRQWIAPNQTEYNPDGQLASVMTGIPTWPITDQTVTTQTWLYEGWSGRPTDQTVIGMNQDDAVHDQLTRLYRSAFNQNPDGWGYRYWSSRIATGTSIATVATDFENAVGFDTAWANYTDPFDSQPYDPAGPLNSDFMNWVFGHILDWTPQERAPHLPWWTNQLDTNAWTRGQVLAYMSDAPEALSNLGIGGTDATTPAPGAIDNNNADVAQDLTYLIDVEGILVRVHDTSAGINQYACYGYNTRYELTSAYTRGDGNCAGSDSTGPDPYSVTYAYDPQGMGNIASATGTNTPGGTYLYGAGNAGPHAVTTAGTRTFDYDNAGNMTTRDTYTGGNQTLTYTLQNRLKTITGAGTTMTVLYDAEGNRVKRTLNGTTTYSLGEAFETDGTTPTIHHRLGKHIGTTIGTAFTAVATDHLGSPTLTRDTAGTTTTTRFQPYGQTRGQTTPTITGQPFDLTFTGQTSDPGTGLYDYNARHYDPTLARFAMADPILDSTNRYTYVRNNPIRYTDPTGNCGQGDPRTGAVPCTGQNQVRGSSAKPKTTMKGYSKGVPLCRQNFAVSFGCGAAGAAMAPARMLVAIDSPGQAVSVAYQALSCYPGTICASQAMAENLINDARENGVASTSGILAFEFATLAWAAKSPRVKPGAPSPARPAIGFAPGEGVTALTPGRLQHGTAHLTKAGVLPAWSGKYSPQIIRDTLSPILESPTATFNNTLGGTQVKGFVGTVNGQTVAVQVYAEGPLAGQLATSVIPSPNQLTKWGVAP